MKNQRNAIEIDAPVDWVPIAYARSSSLMAVLWDTMDGCRFTVFRANRETGEPDNPFRPRDAEHLVRLTVVMSFAMQVSGLVDGELSDDLGCLSHCLSQTLGIDLTKFETGDPMVQ